MFTGIKQVCYFNRFIHHWYFVFIVDSPILFPETTPSPSPLDPPSATPEPPPPSPTILSEASLSPSVSGPKSPISVSSSPENGSQLWIAKLDLYKHDKEILCSTAWLNDSIIFAAQSLLAKQSKGKIFGFQSTQLCKTKNLFRPVPPGPFVQVLHISGCHWAVVSNINVQSAGSSHSDAVAIYDSARPTDVAFELKKIICSFFKCMADAIRFDLVNVETQKNSFDCGILSIAMATELVAGNDPAGYHWDTAKMRPHLLACFEQGSMTPFPKLGRRRIPFGSRVRVSVLEKVFCIPTCRMPNDKDRGMTSCDSCPGWFHFDCVQLDEKDSSSTETLDVPKMRRFPSQLT